MKERNLKQVQCPDDRLLEGCFGSGDGARTKERWVTITKAGFILILARHERGGLAFENGYRALRWGGRFLRAFFKLVSSSPFWRLLPSFEVTKVSGALIDRLEEEFQGRVKAILFGNPVQVHRRAMIQILRDNGEVIMVKSGFTEDGVASIRREHAFLTATHLDPSLRPKLLGVQLSKQEGRIALEWLKGTETMNSRKIEKSAVRFLRRFRYPRSFVTLEELRDWDDLVWRHEIPSFLRKRVLVKTLTHGDFALWNILKRGPHLVAVDWEWSEESGIAGLDLVHLHFQDSAMVKGLSEQKLVDFVIKRLNREVSKCFLLDCGWERVEEVLVVYLATLNPIFKGVGPESFKRLVEQSSFDFS